MATTPRAPKQWQLSKAETVNSFENWRQNLLYILALDPNFAPFLTDDARWEKKSRTSPHRWLIDDGEDVPNRKTRDQKLRLLELMLGQIANFCPIISRNSIVKNSTSLEWIWQLIRQHFGFQSTGGHFLDFDNIQLSHEERPEDLYQRLMAFVEDSLLKRESQVTHHGVAMTEDEEMSPTLENMVILTWLRLINPNLPRLVKQRYGTELRTRTLASIKPEISQALNSLLDELRSVEDAKSLRATLTKPTRPPVNTRNTSTRRQVSCPLCKQAGRRHDHFLSQCNFLPPEDKKYMVKARQIANILDNQADDESEEQEEQAQDNPSHLDDPVVSESHYGTYRVKVCQSPYLQVFHDHIPVKIIIDSGATGNMIRKSLASRLGLHVLHSSQSAHQADGSSPLKVVGETRFLLSREGHSFYFEGLVVEDLDVEVIAGIPFMAKNDITIRPAKSQISLSDGTVWSYGSLQNLPNETSVHTIRRAHVVRAPSTQTTIWPGEYIEVDIPRDLAIDEQLLALEPRTNSTLRDNAKDSALWPPPTLVSSISGRIRIPNLTSEPQSLRSNEHFCQERLTDVTSGNLPDTHTIPPQKPNHKLNYVNLHSASVHLDEANILPTDIKSKFSTLLADYDDVFDPNFKGYNGAAGNFVAHVNMGPVQPPQRKGRIPQYSRNQLLELQQKFDELEKLGVFRKPEDLGISVEYLNPSFLVKKSNGSFRLVTSFGDVGKYSKPQPSLLPNVDSTLRLIGKWKYLIVSDLAKSFYQIPLAKESAKYCGVVTPFKGILAYSRCAMGMPGSETALEELMCRVLGDLVQEGIVVKLADDLYCGGNSPNELLNNWSRVLQSLRKCSINLLASKTYIAPKSTTILGWIWEAGSIRASPHRIATLANCAPPTTVNGLRSYIGAYKILARVLPNCAILVSPLENETAGKQSKDQVTWSDDLLRSFKIAQEGLSSAQSVTLPKPEDQLWIVTDGSVKRFGLGATLYVSRGKHNLVAGFFSAKLRQRQLTWIPCEIEALSIATAIKHFSPYIVQSDLKPCIITDSKPCVQAFEKLCRGEFSVSPRVSTFLSIASRYQCSIRHAAGAAILPSDFASRNAPDCSNPTCQICSFISETEESVVLRTDICDDTHNNMRLPYATRSTWLAIQEECPDLRRVCAHLKQGTRPTKKETTIKDVKRYLNVASIACDGLLVVKRVIPLMPTNECIIVPREVISGLLMAMHIKLQHPSSHQLKQVMRRQFYALDMDHSIDSVTQRCHHCASLRKPVRVMEEQTSLDLPDSVGLSLAADVIKRERQAILVVRENVTSYTVAQLIPNEQKDTLLSTLIQLCLDLRPMDGPPTVIRCDNAPGFRALSDNKHLEEMRLSIELGRAKNINKNPVAERAIQEVEEELLHQDPCGGAVTPLMLSKAVSRLNSRIRHTGLSSREMWYRRDQFSNRPINIDDEHLIRSKTDLRSSNHQYSECAKGGIPPANTSFVTGDVVYLRSDKLKTRGRERYLVTSIDGNWCNIRKFTNTQLRNTSYRVRQSDIFKVPASICDISLPYPQKDNESDDEDHSVVPTPIRPPNIPLTISQPLCSTDNLESADIGSDLPVVEHSADTHLPSLPAQSSHETLASNANIPVRPKRTCSAPKRFEDYELY